MNAHNYAAFIMTYKRPTILADTINRLLEQSIPPNEILIIDNDPDQSAFPVSKQFQNNAIAYIAVGYNSGPAGAAKLGLENLTKKGYSWIAWIDDDNPPIFENIFEKLIQLASTNEKVGSVGVVGQRYNRRTGLMIRVPDKELEGRGHLSVDNIAGGMCKLVNADVVRKNQILPDSSLFYGFEELDFDLRIKNEGYSLLADKEMYKKHRAYYNRLGLQIKRGEKKEKHALWREYYSIRNSLIILKKNKLYIALFITLIRISIKSIVAFRFGFSYGKKVLKNATIACIHFCIGKRGAYAVND